MPVAFKVVRGKKVFRPATDSALQRVRYRLHETTHQGDHGPFTLFESLADARKFLARNYGDVILACEYEPSDELVLWKKKPPVFTKNRSYKRGYSVSSAGVVERSVEGCPDGTIVARAVTPFLLINDDDPDDLTLTPPDDNPETDPFVGRVVFDNEGGFRVV